MSGSEFSEGSEGEYEGGAPMLEVIYPVGEETEVPRTNAKLFKTVLVEGTGPCPPKGAKVSVHYVGTLASDGSKFDSSRDRNDLFEFDLGKGAVIKGWDEGVATMKKGEKAILKCLPDYAYGAGGSPPKIPPNSTLNFEVELFDWTKDEDISKNKDRTLMKSTITEGKDFDKPDYESECVFDIAVKNGATDALLCEKKGVVATLGETDLPTGLEELLKSMRREEEATLLVAGNVKQPSANAEYCVKANEPVSYHVTLAKFTKIRTWEVKGAEKVAEGLKRKDQGNEYFKAGDLKRAEAKYKRALEFIEYDHGLDDEAKAEQRKLKIPVLSNLAAVLLKTQDYAGVITNCDKCIETSGDVPQPKALFRRGRAHLALDNWELARADLKRCLEVEPGNGDAINELALVDAKINAHKKKEKKAFGGMFEKMAKMEAKENPTPAAAEAPAAEAPAPASE